MDSGTREQNGFVGYEYKEVAAEGNRLSLLLDGYENFGWELDGRLMEGSGEYEKAGKDKKNIPYLPQKMVLRFRRNRKVINKTELTRLQRHFEACINELDRLEREKTSFATVYALVCGILGTAFLAGSTFAVTAQPPHYILCIILAIPGFLGWIFPYFIYKKMVEKQTRRIIPLIEEKYDEIYEICEKGHKLLH